MLARLTLLTSLVAAAAAAQTPTFKTGVDLVRFDIRVVDGAGHPITDLRQDEIRITESGEGLPVILFQRVSEPSESYTNMAVRAVTAEVSSNEAFPRGHLYILIFDQEHITAGNEQRARVAAEEFIRRRVRATDRVALFAIPGPGPQIGFTAEKLRIINELPKIHGTYRRTASTPVGTLGIYEAHRIAQGDETLIVNAIERTNSETGADFIAVRSNGRQVANASDDRTEARRVLVENARTVVAQSDAASRQFLQRLADVIAGFRDIEGRKTVVFFSEGFVQDNLSRELETVAAAAAESYCVFYTFDLNRRGPQMDETAAPTTVQSSEIQARIAPLATLAVETDGTMIVDAASHTQQALDVLAEQAQHYYLVGFTPSIAARQNRGSYHRVTVKVTRPGARVIARTGYAVSPSTVLADRRGSINNVLGAPFAQQGLKIDYTTYVMKAPEAGQQRVVLSLTADLPVRSAPDEKADVVFVVRDVRDGRVVASGTDTMALPASARPGAALGNGSWRVQFNVPAGAYLMRTVVREPGGLTGSADRRLDVRPLNGPDLAVSDLILGSAVSALPVRPRAYAGDGLSGVIETYGRSSLQLQGLDVKIDLRRAGTAETIAMIAADLEDGQEDPLGVSRRARFLLPLAGVPPGDYVAHAVVKARGETIGERTRQVEVLAGSAPPLMAEEAAARVESVRPVEVVRGDLARKYIAALRQRAEGTPAGPAARDASDGRWEQVEAGLRRVPADDDAVASALRGLALFVREDYAGAAAALNRSFEADPANALTAFFLGWAADGAGDARAAIGAWRNAAHLDPTLVSAHLALADGYVKLSQPALAVQALRAGLAALPSSPELQTRLRQLERNR